MKRIEAIVPQSSKLQVLRALEDLGLRFTHYGTKGRGKTPASLVEFDRGTSTMREEFTESATIMTVVPDSVADEVVEKILGRIPSGTEGVIFVCEVKDAIDLKTKKRGDSIL